MSEISVLAIDDDPEILEYLSTYLTRQGMKVHTIEDSLKAVPFLKENSVDCLITDYMMPNLNGFKLARAIQQFSSVPIIMLTAIDEDVEKIAALESCVDKYLVKPVKLPVLVAEIKVLVRTNRKVTQVFPKETVEKLISQTIAYRFCGCELDTNLRTLRCNQGEVKPLSTGEFQLLECFVKQPNRIFTRQQLLDVIDNNNEAFDRSIDVLISRLRKKLSQGEANITAVRGVGYQFLHSVARVTKKS